MSASLKGALIISLGYLLMIAAAVIAAFYLKKGKAEMQKKTPDKYDLVGRIMAQLFRGDD